MSGDNKKPKLNGNQELADYIIGEIKTDQSKLEKALEIHIETSNAFRNQVTANKTDISWMKRGVWGIFLLVAGRLVALIGWGK